MFITNAFPDHLSKQLKSLKICNYNKISSQLKDMKRHYFEFAYDVSQCTSMACNGNKREAKRQTTSRLEHICLLFFFNLRTHK
jgi:hypothetical protein